MPKVIRRTKLIDELSSVPTVQTSQLADLAVDTSKLAGSAVVTSKVAAGTINQNKLEIINQHGQCSLNYASVSVSFPKTFSATPTVALTPKDTFNDDIRVVSISTDGFYAYGSPAGSAYWIAVGSA